MTRGLTSVTRKGEAIKGIGIPSTGRSQRHCRQIKKHDSFAAHPFCGVARLDGVLVCLVKQSGQNVSGRGGCARENARHKARKSQPVTA
jgi:hypothetical protein